MRAPIVRVTIGDYLYRMPGFLESVNITVDNGSPWEINLDGDSAQLPQVVDVAVTFKPILSELPRRSTFGAEKLDQKTTSVINNPEEVQTITAQQNNPSLIANNGSFIESNTPVSATIKTAITQEQAFRNITPKFSSTIKNPVDILAENRRKQQAEEINDFLSTGGFKNN
jgi:hypothetical protein